MHTELRTGHFRLTTLAAHCPLLLFGGLRSPNGGLLASQHALLEHLQCCQRCVPAIPTCTRSTQDSTQDSRCGAMRTDMLRAHQDLRALPVATSCTHLVLTVCYVHALGAR
jgi:hypothetical protein